MPMWNISRISGDAQSLVEAEGSDALPNLSQYTLDFPKLKKSENILSFVFKYCAALLKTGTC